MKKLLSIILAIAMVIALLPAAFAAADAETGNTVYKYEFTLSGAGEEVTEEEKASDNSIANNSEKNYYNSVLGMEKRAIVFGMGNDSTEAGDDWSFAGASGTYGSTDLRYKNQLTPDGFWWYGNSSSIGSLGSYGVTFKIVIPENGKYIPTIKYLPYESEGTLHAYIIDDAINGKQYSGNSWAYNFETTTAVDTNGTANTSTGYLANSLKAGESKPAEMTFLLSGEVTKQKTVPTSSDAVALAGEPITLDAGTYYLFIAGATNRYLPYIHSFELEKLPVTKYEFTLAGAGETADRYNSVLYGETDVSNTKLIEKGMGTSEWSYIGERGLYTATDTYSSQLSNYGFWWYSADGHATLGSDGIVFEINVPADGEYTTALNYLPCMADGTVYACIIDKAIDGRLHTNDYPYDFCDTVSDLVTISDSVYYALTTLQASLTGGKDLRSEITLALSGTLKSVNTNKVTTDSVVSLSGTDTVALKAGEYYLLIAKDGSNKYMPYINSFEIEKVGELDTALDAAFTVNKQDDYEYTAPTVASFTSDGESITVEKNEKGYYDITAPEQNRAGESFLYWAKGLTAKKRIVSWTNVITNYVPDDSGTNYLIAVYDSEGPTEENAEYYNANGQLIAIGEKPTELSMAGYGSFSEWKPYGEKHIYVAEYDNKTQPDNVTVKVNGKDKTVPYGTSVTCTADVADESGNPFKCWKKTNLDGTSEIVSIDKKYTFKAWETCTVTAEYEEHSFVSVVMKIITDSFDVGSEKGIMAEFVGFDNKVVEKGIMFGDNRIAMTAPGSQFSVVADKNGKYKGYAIVKNTDETYSLITGNEITVSNAE
ncbi:MAG: hypothetical protein IJF32_13175 [Oscillospiraceae bacterium]|nr:hypothetical protein [Oscillospiraceae bacterium]